MHIAISEVGRLDARFFPGSHSLPYWPRDTRAFVAWLRGQFGHPPRSPSTIVVASAHTPFTAWGWTFHALRRVREFLYLRLRRTDRPALICATILSLDHGLAR